MFRRSDGDARSASLRCLYRIRDHMSRVDGRAVTFNSGDEAADLTNVQGFPRHDLAATVSPIVALRVPTAKVQIREYAVRGNKGRGSKGVSLGHPVSKTKEKVHSFLLLLISTHHVLSQ